LFFDSAEIIKETSRGMSSQSKCMFETEVIVAVEIVSLLWVHQSILTEGWFKQRP